MTSGLLDRLDEGELEAVLAHELMHIANYDSYVLTPASFLASLGALLYRNLITWVPLWFIPYVIGSGVMFTLSRYREYVADRGAAVLTGAPEQLMSALQKIAAETSLIPSDDLRTYAGLNAFFIVPSHPYRTRWELRMDHPPLTKRLARLAKIAREMGKPERPSDWLRTPTRVAAYGQSMIGPHSQDEPARPDDPFGGRSPLPDTNTSYQLARRAVSTKDDDTGGNPPGPTRAQRCPPNWHWDDSTAGCVPDTLDPI